jgi:hypothetical protein
MSMIASMASSLFGKREYHSLLRLTVCFYIVRILRPCTSFIAKTTDILIHDQHLARYERVQGRMSKDADTAVRTQPHVHSNHM